MIQIKDLGVRFNEESIFQNFSLSINPGEKLAITGESGKGKSTLLNVLAGFIPDFQGSIIINGKELHSDTLHEIRSTTAWLPQETNLNLPTMRELFFTPFAFTSNKKQQPTPKQVSEILEAFDLEGSILDKNTKEVSGGQKQRVLLASCILLKKPILLLDEPTSALDEKTKVKVTDYVLSQKAITILAVTHDDYWGSQSDRVLEL